MMPRVFWSIRNGYRLTQQPRSADAAPAHFSGPRACAAAIACGALIALSLSPTAGADIVFRCAGANGVPVYSDHVCGPHATRIEVQAPTTYEAPPTPVPQSPASPNGTNGSVHLDLHNSNVVNAAPAESAAVPAVPAESGGELPFSVFRRLDTGMSEGKLLAIAGPPARETVDSINTAEGIQRKSYYYVNHGYNASITHIQIVNGRVVRIDRTPLMGN